MARNKIQFQKGLSESEFYAQYGTEQQCLEALQQMRWPNGCVFRQTRSPIPVLFDHSIRLTPKYRSYHYW